jgi:hypothetical protein
VLTRHARDIYVRTRSARPEEATKRERGLAALETDERRAAAEERRLIIKSFYVDDEIFSL